MNWLSNTGSNVRILGRCMAAFAAALLGASCSGPSARIDRAAVATQAVVAAEAGALSSEFDLDNARVVERARACPQVAFGTAGYLVTHSDPIWGQIGATRFDRSGQKLQAFDIPGALLHWSNGSSNECAPLVFADGAYVALWAADDGTLWCTRLAEDGSLLNGGGVSTGFSSSAVESATLGGSKVLASMSDGKVALIGTDCSGISATVALPATPGATRWPEGAAFDGTQYWVAYSETLNGVADRFLVQAVSPLGAPSGTPITVATAPWLRTPAGFPSYYLPGVQGSVAVGGGTTAVAYSIYLNQTPSPPDFNTFDLHYAELSSAGVLGNDASLTPALADPKLAFAGDGFVFVSAAGDYATLKRLSDGTTLSSSLYTTLSGTQTIAIAHDGTNLLVARAGATAQNGGASYVELIGADLQPVVSATILQQMSERHEATVVASGAQTSLSVWVGPDRTFWGSRLSAAGSVLDQSPFAVHPRNALESSTNPVVASNGTDFLVGWGENTAGAGDTARTHAVLVTGSGEVGPSFVVSEGTNGLDAVPYGFAPVVASNGSDYLMVWGHGDGIYIAPDLISRFSVEAARITSTGMVLDDPPLVLQSFSQTNPTSPGGYAGEFAVAYDGAQYVVLSHVAPVGDLLNGGPLTDVPNSPIVVQHVSNAGDIGSPVETPWQAGLYDVSSPPVLTWGTGQGLVAFAHGDSLFAGRLSAALEPLDAPAVLVTEPLVTADDWRFSAAWDGTTYWVSWKDGRRNIPGTDDLYLARVSPNGVVLDPSGVVLSQSDPTGHQTTPGGEEGFAGGALASGQGRALAAYTRFNPASDVFNFVLHGRWLSNESAAGGGAGTSGGTAGGNTGTGGTGVGEAGSPGEAGSAGSQSPSDNGGANGGSVATDGGSVATDGGRTSTGGSATTSGGSATTSGGSATTSGGSATTSGSSSDSPSPRDRGCSIGTRKESANPPLLWFATLALSLLHRARRRKSVQLAPTAYS
jgi:hypothetical protein